MSQDRFPALFRRLNPSRLEAKGWCMAGGFSETALKCSTAHSVIYSKLFRIQTVRVFFFNKFLDRQNLFVAMIPIMLKNNMTGSDAECFLPIQYAIFFSV